MLQYIAKKMFCQEFIGKIIIYIDLDYYVKFIFYVKKEKSRLI